MRLNAHEFLSQIIKNDAIIANKLREVKRWSDVARSLGGISSGERVQTSSNFGRVPDAVCRYVDLEREIKDLKRKRAAIIKLIEQLPPLEYELIYKLYIGEYDENLQIFVPYTHKEVAYQYGKSYDWVKKKKKKALEMVQRLIDGENKA